MGAAVKAYLSSILILTLFLSLFAINFNLFNPWPISGFFIYGPLTICLVGFVASCFLLAGRERELRFSIAPIVLLLPLLVGLALVFLEGKEVNSSSLGWQCVFLILIGVAGTVAGEMRQVTERDGYAQSLAWITVSSISIYAVLAVLYYYGALGSILSGLKPEPGRLGGAWHQPNLTASTVWIGVVGLAFITQIRRSLFFLVPLVVFAAVIGLTASRINYLFIIMAFLLGGIAIRQQKSKIDLFGKNLLVAGCVVALSLMFFPTISAWFEPVLVEMGWMPSQSATSIADRGMVSSARIQEHLKILSALTDWGWQQWLFGVGPGNYGNFSFEQAVRSPEVGQGQAAWLHSHNLFSMILVEQGLVGTIAIILVLLLIARQLWVHRGHAYAWLVAAVLAIIFLHSMVEYPLWYPWYLWVTLLFLVPVFPAYSIPITSPWLMRIAAVMIIVVGGAVVLNQAYLGYRVISIAGKNETSVEDYRELSMIGADGLMGGYATLARYRKFAPDRSGIDRQLQEVRWMEQWRPVDLVKARKVTLFLLDGRFSDACRSARRTVKRYPHTGPILAKKIVKVGEVDMKQLNEYLTCIEEGLEPWGETIESMEKRNSGKIAFSDKT